MQSSSASQTCCISSSYTRQLNMSKRCKLRRLTHSLSLLLRSIERGGGHIHIQPNFHHSGCTFCHLAKPRSPFLTSVCTCCLNSASAVRIILNRRHKGIKEERVRYMYCLTLTKPHFNILQKRCHKLPIKKIKRFKTRSDMTQWTVTK